VDYTDSVVIADFVVTDSSGYGFNATQTDPILMQYSDYISSFGYVTMNSKRIHKFFSSTKEYDYGPSVIGL
jgi:hypothetical protein